MSVSTTVSKSSIEAGKIIKGVIGHLTGPVGSAVDSVVVDAYEDAVGRDMQVGLEVPVSKVDCASEGLHGVLGP